MKKGVLLICGIIAGYSGGCMAADPIQYGADFQFDGCVTTGCVNPEWYPGASPTARNCDGYTNACTYDNGRIIGVASCYSCKSGYDLVTRSSGITACSQYDYDIYDSSGEVNYYSYTQCEKNCSSSNCKSDDWVKLREGYDTRTYRSCSTTGAGGTCNASTQYRCAKGYYGTTSNGTSGCTQCPPVDDKLSTKQYGTTSTGGKFVKTDCYVEPGTYYDTTGTFKVSGGNCSYKLGYGQLE